MFPPTQKLLFGFFVLKHFHYMNILSSKLIGLVTNNWFRANVTSSISNRQLLRAKLLQVTSIVSWQRPKGLIHESWRLDCYVL